MKARLLLATVFMFALPIWLSPSKGDKLNKPTPFAMVALAGHNLLGNWCSCGSQDCICDPGETGGNFSAPTTDRKRDSARTRTGAGSPLDPGAGALMLALAFFLWTRLRA